MPVNIKTKIVEKTEISEGIYKFGIVSSEICKETKPGQFLQIKVSEGTAPLLRRPISIYNIEKEKDLIEFIFQIKGQGTDILSKKSVDDDIEILGPLGYGVFDTKDYNKIAILGGGIGVFPLYELAKEAKQKGIHVDIYLGFRSKVNVILEDDFKKVCDNLYISTDDGTYGYNGFAINILKENIKNNDVDCIYACGPLGMLKAVKKYSEENSVPCQISLEEKMGCGIGACLGCAVKMIVNGKEKFGHVCKNGPVFDSNSVEI